MTVRGACHCTAVRFEVAELPDWALDCNCTLCRRYGAIWAYPPPGSVRFVQGAGATDTYAWLERALAFHRCKECGCVTHIEARDAVPPRVYAVNARLIPSLDPAGIRLLQCDNGHTGFFWTRSLQPPLPSRHPRMPRPGPEDWR